MTRDLRDDPRDVDERVDEFPDEQQQLREPLESLPAWWGPFVDDSDQQQLGGRDCDLAKYVRQLGEPLLEFAKSGPRRRFLVCEEINVSRWAGVYVAIDCYADRIVVLKISRHAIDREARLTVRASHPNVVTVFDAFVCQGHPTMVMEWCSRGTLLDYARCCEDWKQVLVRGLEAGRGLAHFHAQGKVHGDLKPTNILIADDTGKLADFGIARSRTEEGDFGGTRAFAPPERFIGDWQPAGDVYSYAETLRSALARFQVPRPVRALLKAAKADDPERRPTMTALLADLDRAIDREPISDEPKQGRRLWLQAAGVVMSAAIVTGTVVLAAVCSLPDEVEVTLELAAKSVEDGDGQSAVQYLEAGRLRAGRAFDRDAKLLVADEAIHLGERLAEQGDVINAAYCWDIAREIFIELDDQHRIEGVHEIARRWGVVTPDRRSK